MNELDKQISSKGMQDSNQAIGTQADIRSSDADYTMMKDAQTGTQQSLGVKGVKTNALNVKSQA